MKFKQYLVELKSKYGKGITFVDLDETLFHTFAKIYVMKDGKVIKKLNNQEFNTYELKPGESYDFREFRDAETFRKTSIPIPKTVNRIKRMFRNIDLRKSRVVLLTARADFDDKEVFLQTFRDHGIPIDKIYVERTGNLVAAEKSQGRTLSIAGAKERTIMKYINTGEYRRVRLIDDDIKNIRTFLQMEDKLPQKLIDKIKKKHDITDEENIPVIEFFGLLVKKDGSLRRIE